MESLWPVIILWIVFSLLGARKKKAAQRPPAPRAAAGQGAGGFMSEVQQALEEMKRAAAEQQARQQQHEPTRAEEQAAAAERYIEAMRRKKAQEGRRPGRTVVFRPGEGRRTPVVRPQRPLEDDDAEKSSEDEGVVSLEVADYDVEADQVAAVRAQAADRGARTRGPAEEMSAAQLARRAQRTPLPLGTATEHTAWHQEIGAQPAAAATPARAGRLARWADGSVRGAVVLAEILARPGGVAR